MLPPGGAPRSPAAASTPPSSCKFCLCTVSWCGHGGVAFFIGGEESGGGKSRGAHQFPHSAMTRTLGRSVGSSARNCSSALDSTCRASIHGEFNWGYTIERNGVGEEGGGDDLGFNYPEDEALGVGGQHREPVVYLRREVPPRYGLPPQMRLQQSVFRVPPSASVTARRRNQAAETTKQRKKKHWKKKKKRWQWRGQVRTGQTGWILVRVASGSPRPRAETSRKR